MIVPIKPIPQRTRALPSRPHAPAAGVVALCRVEHETLGTSFRALALKYGVPPSTLGYISKVSGWMKHAAPGGTIRNAPVGARTARDVEIGMLAAGLRRQPRDKDGTLCAVNRGGAPRKNVVPEAFAAEAGKAVSPDPEAVSNQPPGPVQPTPEKAGLEATRPAAAPPALSDEPDNQPARKHWGKDASDPPAKPEPATSGRAARRGSLDTRTADVIDFPGFRAAPAKLAGPVQLLPDQTREEKAQLRVTLAAIRAMMSVEQAQLLDQHLNRLLRYGHLIDVYADPARFVPDDPDLDEAARIERIVAMQQAARRILLPTDRDTLAGALKMLTAALRETIPLQRSVVGLDKRPVGAFRSSDPDDPLGERAGAGGDYGDGRRAALSGLRQVQQAMKALEDPQHRMDDPPLPPPPGLIDDLRRPSPLSPPGPPVAAPEL
jgi:hypothetical protein